MNARGAGACLATALLLQAAIAPAVHGQVVRGRLSDAADQVAVSGAMMTLMDRGGRAADQVLTRSGSGLFVLRASEPGEYRVRAERIGYETTFSRYLTLSAGDTVTVQMAAPVEALSLEGISATVGPRCEVRPEDGLAVARVWNEARKALAAATWTQERGLYRYEMLQIKRLFDTAQRTVDWEDRVYADGLVPVPYVARAADSLVYDGFAHLSAEASLFWAPDAEVLLSDPFLDTHCLRIRPGAGDSGLVGLEFEPLPGREVADIAGTFWLDAATAQLQRVEFRYVNLPVPSWLMEASPGGAVHFRALPDGTWIVTSWHIRMFRAGETEHPLTGRPTPTLEGVAVTQGEVLRVHGADGVVLEGRRGRRVAGTVVDSLGVGLPDALVYVAGSSTGMTTDAEGRFELDHMAAGNYKLYFTHPYLEQLWYEPEPVDIDVGADASSLVEVRIDAPAMGDVLAEVCGRDGPPSVLMITTDGRTAFRTGVLTGRVTDMDGTPVDDAEVRLLAAAYEPRLLLETWDPNTLDVDQQRFRWTGKSSSSGFYRACWLPADVPIELLVVGKDEGVDRAALDAALSFTDVYGDRVVTITIDPESPQRKLDLRVKDRD